MDLQRSIESNNSLYPAKFFWPDWPENVQCQLSGQIVLARLARQWPDFAGYSLPIADLIAIFYTNAILTLCMRMSDRSLEFGNSHYQGHSQGHFVLDSHLALKRHFYRTLSQLKSAKSYLMVKLKNLASHILNNCISVTCLFDGYLTEVHCKSYKTPKLVGHRDTITVLNPVHI